MALNSSGPISLAGTTTGQSIAVELSLGATTQISLNDTAVRTLAGVPSGAITMPTNFYGKSSGFSGAISTNQTNLNLRTWALANGWNGTTPATITVNSGVYVWSNAIATAAMTINGAWPGGVTLVNNGYIMGQGGQGEGFSGSAVSTVGGPAISLGINTTIINNSYIGGGGGGGGKGAYAGGGGGAGGGVGGCGAVASVLGGTGGAIGASGTTSSSGNNTGGGGGRVFPGSGGAGGNNCSAPSYGCGKGGTAGGGGGAANVSYGNGVGGAGGSAGSAGASAVLTGGCYGAGGGGGWGASGGSGILSSNPMAGGKAIALNGFTATRSGSGATYGAVA